MDLAELREVLHERIVEAEPTPIAELHDGDAGQGLRHGAPMEDGVLVDRPLLLEVGHPVEDLRHGRPS